MSLSIKPGLEGLGGSGVYVDDNSWMWLEAKAALPQTVQLHVTAGLGSFFNGIDETYDFTRADWLSKNNLDGAFTDPVFYEAPPDYTFSIIRPNLRATSVMTGQCNQLPSTPWPFPVYFDGPQLGYNGGVQVVEPALPEPPGTIHLHGTGMPGAGLGIGGSYYYQDDSGDLWQKRTTGTGWVILTPNSTEIGFGIGERGIPFGVAAPGSSTPDLHGPANLVWQFAVSPNGGFTQCEFIARLYLPLWSGSPDAIWRFSLWSRRVAEPDKFSEAEISVPNITHDSLTELIGTFAATSPDTDPFDVELIVT